MKIQRDERIGETLLRFKVLERYHIENILTRQQHGDIRSFGEIAVDLRYLDRETLNTYLKMKGLPLYEKDKKSMNLADNWKNRNYKSAGG